MLPSRRLALPLLWAGSTLAAGVGVQVAALHVAAGALALAIAVLGALLVTPLAVLTALPAVALLPGGGPLVLAVAAAIAIALTWWWRAADAPTGGDAAPLHRALARYPVLLDACLELSGARDTESLGRALVDRAVQLAPQAHAVWTFLGTAPQLACVASRDAEGEACPREPTEAEFYVATEARALTQRAGGWMRLHVPLRADRRQAEATSSSRGVLVVELPGEALADRQSLELLHALGRLAGLGLATVDLLREARALALHDDLTGLYGQHEFLRRLDEQVASARRHRHPLSLLMCDLDHLKRFNDRFGHAAGDLALKGVAAALTATMPADAIACRYGGEEFTLLLPGIEPAQAAALAETLRQAISAARPDTEHPDRTVTASVGCASLREHEEPRALLARADAAAYAAKRAGRNRVQVAS